jgi:DNA adenine methylase
MLPLIKWSGGKRDELAHILPHVPQYNRYIEPFVGGGAVFFHLAPASAVIADVHPDLIALYSSVKAGRGKDIHAFMQSHPNTPEEYYRVRDEMSPANDFERACKFYYERKTCYRGMLRYNKKGKFNIPFGRYKTVQYDDLLKPEYEELLKRTEIRCAPFETIFAEYNDPSNFVFLDPPYDSEFTDYGYCSFDREHHKRLAECFKTTKNKCLMVIGATPFIRELYNGYIVEEFEKKYAFKLHSGRVGSEINTTHLVITNYASGSNRSTTDIKNAE